MADTAQASKPEQMQEKAHEVTDQAREKAQEAAGQARSRLTEQVDERSNQAAERINATSADLRSVGQELRRQGKDSPARLADQAAERVERVGGYLAQSDPDRMLRDIEDFGRRQPLAVLAGGVVLGIVAARFLKASSTRRYQSHTALSNGAHQDGAQRMLAPANGHAAPTVTPAKPDPGEHHQRFEGHN